jgi:hypothetical protein
MVRMDFGHRQVEGDAAGDHRLNSSRARRCREGQSSAAGRSPIARLVVRDAPADRRREDPSAEGVRQSPDEGMEPKSRRPMMARTGLEGGEE